MRTSSHDPHLEYQGELRLSFFVVGPSMTDLRDRIEPLCQSYTMERMAFAFRFLLDALRISRVVMQRKSFKAEHGCVLVWVWKSNH
jgi:hypothetical protein